jgi:dTMP kinase
MSRGHFITIEGGEGAGKSTQVRRLTERLRLRGIDVVTTREPGGSPGAEIVRHVILSGAAKPLGPTTEAMLFAAARDDHVQSLIRPALERGAWVISDRFMDSTRVYQGALGRVDQKLIEALEHVTVGDCAPTLTFVLDVPYEVGVARLKERGNASDRFESEDREFHERLRDGFRELARSEPDRCVLIDASQGPDVVAVRIWMNVVERLMKGRSSVQAPRTAV